MPKPGKSSKGNHQHFTSWKNQYREHDDRGDRRVTFKHSKHGRKNNRNWSASLEAHFQEEDVDMGGSGGGFTSAKNFRRKGRSGTPPPKGAKRKLLDSPVGWFRVTIPYGHKYEKNFILKLLMDHVSPLTLYPVMWTSERNVVTFYVDEYKVAEKLNNLDRQIRYPDGFNMIIKVNTGSPNVVDINESMKEKMKLAMAKRYNAATRALDLTKFHADPDLQDVFCALFKPIILLTAIDIISVNIPDLEALNLYDNRIHVLSHLKKLNTKLPNLKILHIGNNKIKDISMLDALSGLPLVDVVLDGNPLCDKYKNQETYISEVRKRFPKVMKLDGVDLPPPISFDISEEVPLPTSQQTFLCNAEGQGIVRQFLEQYIQIFDGETRQPLLQAYHEQATLSMTMAYPYGQHQKNSSWLNWYLTDNRNILRVTDSDRRMRLLKQGHLAVVSFLNDMPATKHDIHSFTVDLCLFTPQLINLTFTGLYKELHSGHKMPPIRYFCRTFVIIPAGSGFCILNEMLHVTNATEEQRKIAFRTPAPAPPVQTPAPPNTPVTTPPSTSIPDDAVKQQMVQAMAQQSGMNLDWSQKCLQETDWNFERAVFVFTELQKQGTVPPEAFVK
ncbi:nuclear RNA export factor 1 isoform X2 [Agrilus planipennis]|uniref:Nuclear RNA export factor 1 isoform X1 n=1 Tax=Agrilus planipennis TaxID=224129 RepID=A0A1W4WFT6_AGRPL|nr:nuclear RNA export factor 1 isoform X1 [Agrilus planipennis]XP_025832412.1 nuclear RNA export factor 1 isoform X2 [Agrilus planipennis]